MPPSLHIRRRLVAVTAAIGLVLPLAHVPVATASVDNTLGLVAQPDKKQHFEPGQPALLWNLRDRFFEYLGDRPTHFFDGAEQGVNKVLDPDDPPATIVWPWVDTVRESEDEVVVHYTGTVSMLSYCDFARAGENPDPAATGEMAAKFRGNCSLDITLSEPWVKFNPLTGRGELSVTVLSKRYSDGTWMGPERVVFAKFEEGAAATSFEDGLVTVSGAPSLLDTAGAQAMGGFIDVGSAMASLFFTYKGDKQLPKPNGYTPTGHMAGIATWGGSADLFPRSDGSVVYVGNVAGFGATGRARVIRRDFDRMGYPVDVDVDARLAAALDTANDVVYTATGTTVVARTMDNDVQISDRPTTVVTLDDGRTITDIAYNPASEVIGITSLGARDAGARYGARFTTFDPATGAARTVDLPAGRDLHQVAEDYLDYYSDETYGSPFGHTNGGLRALSDGTWLYVRDHPTGRLDGTADGKRGAAPVHITPEQPVTATVIETDALGTENDALKSVSVTPDGNGGDTIAIWNSYDGDLGKIAVLHYDGNGMFSTVHTVSGLDNSTVDGKPNSTGGPVGAIAGAGFDAQGRMLVVGATSGVVNVVDPATYEVTQTVGIGEGTKGTQANSNSSLVISNGQVYLLEQLNLNKDGIEGDFGGVHRLRDHNSPGAATTGGNKADGSLITTGTRAMFPPATDTGTGNGDDTQTDTDDGTDSGTGTNTDTDTDTGSSSDSNPGTGSTSGTGDGAPTTPGGTETGNGHSAHTHTGGGHTVSDGTGGIPVSGQAALVAVISLLTVVMGILAAGLAGFFPAVTGGLPSLPALSPLVP
ncbi:HtaA domain-containing protein [Corynebacterium mendelii]|uniref:HtaA domain-containing protein n=1 Tax=Corynebacterium mendelii TaxID=2765362 RepID=A0A939E0I9_9CORY|nr:HtaA domain-containing protein [Corynebacterium mendelii]